MRTFYIVLFFFLSFYISSVYAQNPIVIENQKLGSTTSEWSINGIGDLSIQGFATDISVNKGDRVHFKIKTNARAYSITIFRIGYYQGNGARRVGTGLITAPLPQTQPNGIYDPNTGLLDCGNWKESAYWDVPATAVSGVYTAKLTRSDNGGSQQIIFIVRNDNSNSDLFYQTSDATWQAYNDYGDKGQANSFYGGKTTYPVGRAVKLSYNRPFNKSVYENNFFYAAEYAMVRWLERNGYDVSYTTSVDSDRRGNLIKNHKVFLSVGHDEYWSGQQRANVEAARNAGVSIAFFSGDEVNWKTRWENSVDGSGTSYRTLVCYKEGTDGAYACGNKCDPVTNIWTGEWSAGCEYKIDGCNPQNALTGQIGSILIDTGALIVPFKNRNFRFWRNTSIARLSAGQNAVIKSILGYEIDYEKSNSSYPAGRVSMSETKLPAGYVHKLSLYRHSSGALVFGAGTIDWAWGLEEDRGASLYYNAVPDVRVQQATVNLFADMGAQPGTLQTDLVPSIMTMDRQPPITVITSPLNGITTDTAVIIKGTATDSAGVVARVEISTDGGLTWNEATGTVNWNYTFIPAVAGTYTVKSRSVDDMGNLETNATTANTIQVSTSSAMITYYKDADGDGYGNVDSSIIATSQPSGYVINNSDCNDDNTDVNPGAVEVCGNGIDDNCDGRIDESCIPTISINDVTVYNVTKTRRDATLTISLSNEMSSPITIKYKTKDGTATSVGKYRDYKKTNGKVTIPAGSLNATIAVPIIKSKGIRNKYFYLHIHLLGDSNTVKLIKSTSMVTIIDNKDKNQSMMSSSASSVMTGDTTYINAAESKARIEKDATLTNTFAKEPAKPGLSLKASPNPTANTFNVKVESNSNMSISIRVFDITGKVIQTIKMPGNNSLYIGNKYLAGIYFIEAIQGKERKTLKLIKQ